MSKKERKGSYTYVAQTVEDFEERWENAIGRMSYGDTLKNVDPLLFEDMSLALEEYCNEHWIEFSEEILEDFAANN